MEDSTMKKEYIKPSTRVVLLQYKNRLLAGSPGGYDGRSLRRKDDPNDYIFDEENVW